MERERDSRGIEEEGGNRDANTELHYTIKKIVTNPSLFSSLFVSPAGVPATKPLSELQAPVTKMTTLENGLRVATQETYGAVSQQLRICVH